MDAADKIQKSAQALGVLLDIPAFVDPEKGFANEKVITWENGDKIKVTAIWVEGNVFSYDAFLGQIDPKTNELSYLGGPIATAASLETLVESINNYLSAIAVQTERDTDPAPEIVDDYNALNAQYQELILDPDHDPEDVYECSQKLQKIEVQLRENGIKPGDLLI